MKLVNSDYDISISLKEDVIQVLTIENQQAFRKMVGELWDESEGREGSWILSDKNSPVHISKNMTVVFNPYTIDANDKKVLSKLYSELCELASQKYTMEVETINSHIIGLFSNIIQDIPYFIDYGTDIDLQALFKIYNIKIDVEYTSLIERITDYIRAFHNICSIRVFTFINLKDYLSVEELKLLYEFVLYEKVNLILIEGHQSASVIPEKHLIIDKDLCIINP